MRRGVLRSRATLIVLAALVIVGAGFGVWWLTRDGGKAPAGDASKPRARTMIGNAALMSGDRRTPRLRLLSAADDADNVVFAPDGRELDALTFRYRGRELRRLALVDVSGLKMRHDGDVRLLALRGGDGSHLGVVSIAPAGASAAMDLTHDGVVDFLMQAGRHGVLMGVSSADGALDALSAALNGTASMCQADGRERARAGELVVLCAGQRPPAAGYAISLDGLALDGPPAASDPRTASSGSRLASFTPLAQTPPTRHKRISIRLTAGWPPRMPHVPVCPDSGTLNGAVTAIKSYGIPELRTRLTERGNAVATGVGFVVGTAERTREATDLNPTVAFGAGEGITVGGGVNVPRIVQPGGFAELMQQHAWELMRTAASAHLELSRTYLAVGEQHIADAEVALGGDGGTVLPHHKRSAIELIDLAYDALAKATWQGRISDQQNEYRRYLFGPPPGTDPGRQEDWYRGCGRMLASYSTPEQGTLDPIHLKPDIASAVEQAVAGRAFGFSVGSIHRRRFQASCPPPEPPPRVCIAGFLGSGGVAPTEGDWVDAGFIVGLRPHTVGPYLSQLLLAPPELQGWRVIDEEASELAEVRAYPERWLVCERSLGAPICPRPDSVAPLHPGHGRP